MVGHTLYNLGAPIWNALVHRRGSGSSKAFIRDLLRTLEACDQNYLENGWSFSSKQVCS